MGKQWFFWKYKDENNQYAEQWLEYEIYWDDIIKCNMCKKTGEQNKIIIEENK